MKNFYKYFLFLTFIIVIFFSFPQYKAGIYFLDILGESTLIITPQNKKILIGAGSKQEIFGKFSKYLSFFDKNIELFIIPSDSEKYLGGAFEVLERFLIKQVFLPKNFGQTPLSKLFLEKLILNNIPYSMPESNFFVEKKLYIDFLLNEKNLIFRLIKNKNSIIFFAENMNKEDEKILLKSSLDLKSKILHLSQEGQNKVSRKNFLHAINPETAIITADKENYDGLPHLDLLERLKEENIEIRMTKEEKDIIIPLH